MPDPDELAAKYPLRYVYVTEEMVEAAVGKLCGPGIALIRREKVDVAEGMLRAALAVLLDTIEELPTYYGTTGEPMIKRSAVLTEIAHFPKPPK